jgi:hypothetical protein
MNEKDKQIIIYSVAAALVVIIIVGGTKLIKGITDGVNEIFGDDKTNKAVDAAETQADKLGYFNPSFIRNAPPGTLLLTMKNAKVKATNIYNAIGVIYDKPENIKAAFSNIVTKSQVSFLAEIFRQDYKTDLLSFLRSKLDTDEQQRILAQILNRLNTLPDYLPGQGFKLKTRQPVAVPPVKK